MILVFLQRKQKLNLTGGHRYEETMCFIDTFRYYA